MWALELTQFDIRYHGQNAVKGQAVTDFILECTKELQQENASPSENLQDQQGEGDRVKNVPTWTLCIDEASNQNGSEASLIMIDPQKAEFSHCLRYNFKTSNNEIEYETLIAGLKIAQELKVKDIQVLNDSQLVVNQFDNKKFRKFCNTCKIEYRFASTAHPQTNGLVESTNKTIKTVIKKKMKNAKGNWADELPHILWAYGTTERTATGEK
ncbi:hypothetical protein ACOSQ3_026998 [Xanthoceras sorbifolium]